MIFYFSSQDGETSSQTSTGLAVFVMRLLVPGFDGMSYAEKKVFFNRLTYFVRKAAHFTEFAMLGASLRLLFHALRLRWPVVLAWIVGSLYACSDELHQMFVDGRGAMWQDVAIDSAGVLTAVLLTTLWLWLRKKKKARAAYGKNGPA